VSRPSPWNVANLVTVLRIVVVPFFAWTLLVDGGQDVTWRLVATGLFVLAAATDRVDGYLARRMGLVTDLGKMLDPIADKALIGSALVALSWLGDLSWWVTAAILVRELGITVMRFFLLRYVVLPASRGGKIKTVMQSVAVGAFLLPLDHLPTFALVIASVLMGVAVVVTLVTGADYVRTAVRVRREAAAGGHDVARRAAESGSTAPAAGHPDDAAAPGHRPGRPGGGPDAVTPRR
jgi:CDP-diacylglycerol--glycerol-3-phosphate 3-phosphatidyltransferase/cardiolipin synthase